jgi:hypothetical protein
LDGFGDMAGADPLGVPQIARGAGEEQDPIIGLCLSARADDGVFHLFL